jgi:hypothetical protein
LSLSGNRYPAAPECNLSAEAGINFIDTYNVHGIQASLVEQFSYTLAAADCKLDSALKTRLDEVSIEFRRGDAGK